jgi:manganese/iron transport system ATP-binding protein
VDRLLGQKGLAHDADAPILDAVGVSMRYNGRAALEDVSFHLATGERVAVVGPNGAGKSTLFKVISGVLHPTMGAVNVAGHCPGSHICIAYVQQRSEVDWRFPVTVADVVMMGRAGKIGLFRRAGRGDWAYVRECLEVVDLGDLDDWQIGELSGGQQQRMFIARALAQEAALMLMDEPLSGLDIPSQEGIFDILDRLRGRGVTVMVATHDLNMAADRFDRVMLLNGRLLGIGRPEDVFTPDLLQQAYGDNLRMVQMADGVMVVSDTCCGKDL